MPRKKSGKKNPDVELFKMSEVGNVAAVEALIAAGANVNTEYRQHSKNYIEDIIKTPLHIASEKGHPAVVERLIAAGANINQGDERSNTSLFLACRNGHLAVVERLLASGANVNLTNKYKETPLYEACRKGHAEIVSVLIAAGANINKFYGTLSMTPIRVAYMYRHFEIIDILIAAGADVNKTEESGTTVLMVASIHGPAIIVEKLIAAGADVNKIGGLYKESALHNASKSGQVEIVELLIAAGADLNKVTHYYHETPLFMASQNGHLQVVERLLEAGADKNIREIFGKLPIDVAKTEEIRNLLRNTVVHPNAATLNTIDIPVPNVEAASNALLGDLAEDNVVGYFPNANGKIFASQGITAYRTTDPTTPTNLWSGILESGKNPFTRLAFTGAPMYRRAHLVKTEGGRRSRRSRHSRRGTRKHNRS